MSRTFKDSLEEDLETVFFNINEFANTFTIIRGTKRTPNVAAIVSSRSYSVIHDGLPLSVVSVDFDVIASAYRFDSVQVDPRDGDLFEGVNGVQYEVLPTEALKQSFETTGPDGRVIRIHTKKVS